MRGGFRKGTLGEKVARLAKEKALGSVVVLCAWIYSKGPGRGSLGCPMSGLGRIAQVIWSEKHWGGGAKRYRTAAEVGGQELDGEKLSFFGVNAPPLVTKKILRSKKAGALLGTALALGPPIGADPPFTH